MNMSKPRLYQGNSDSYGNGARFAPPRPLLPRHLARIEPANDTFYEQSFLQDVDYGYTLHAGRSYRPVRRLSAGVAFLIAVPMAAALAAASSVAVVWMWSAPQRGVLAQGQIIPPPPPAEAAQVAPLPPLPGNVVQLPPPTQPQLAQSQGATANTGVAVASVASSQAVSPSASASVKIQANPLVAVKPETGAVVIHTAPVTTSVPSPLSTTDLRSGIAVEGTGAVTKTPVMPDLSAVFPSAIDRFLENAETLLAKGEISSAQLFLERAAEAGNARALFRLAETHDPRALQRWNVVGKRGSVVKARKYYEQAAEKGIPEARERLTTLPQG
jgi:hypothetical protein